MELRLDRLLADLREREADILAAIDADPLLLKRVSGALVLANASQLLYTPQAQHQLYAKGIVYRRDPYRFVSLPLIKIYNVGERDVTVPDLASLTEQDGVKLRFLRKMDGSLVQVFRAEGRVWFTTRGMIEGARWRFDEAGDDRTAGFDYLAQARQMATVRYPQLLNDETLFNAKTLIFEFLHPEARVVTNYGDLADLILLTVFDHRRFAYWPYDDVCAFAHAHGLTVVPALTPVGDHLSAQIESLLASWAGTDEEGAVLTFERAGEVIYRVKVKSPEYLQLMRLMAFCTYDRTVEFVEARPHLRTWADLEAALQEQGRDRVPEEILGYYREHWERFQRYLADLERLRQWAEGIRQRIDADIGGRQGRAPGEYRKAFAEKAKTMPYSALVFAALDGKLDVPRIRKVIRNDTETREALSALGLD